MLVLPSTMQSGERRKNINPYEPSPRIFQTRFPQGSTFGIRRTMFDVHTVTAFHGRNCKRARRDLT